MAGHLYWCFGWETLGRQGLRCEVGSAQAVLKVSLFQRRQEFDGKAIGHVADHPPARLAKQHATAEFRPEVTSDRGAGQGYVEHLAGVLLPAERQAGRSGIWIETRVAALFAGKAALSQVEPAQVLLKPRPFGACQREVNGKSVIDGLSRNTFDTAETLDIGHQCGTSDNWIGAVEPGAKAAEIGHLTRQLAAIAEQEAGWERR